MRALLIVAALGTGASAGPGLDLHLASAGKHPAKLRYAPKKGDKHSISVAVTGTGDGLPNFNVDFDYVVADVDKDGTATLDVTVKQATIPAGPHNSEVHPPVAGAHGKLAVTATGVIGPLAFETDKPIDADSKGMLGGFAGMVTGCVTQLPGEAIGAGATWNYQVSAGATLMNAKVEVVKLANNKLTVHQDLGGKLVQVNSGATQIVSDAEFGLDDVIPTRNKLVSTSSDGHSVTSITIDLVRTK
ncbi:MAG: hypothetical protein QM831_14105 [Kofleriaceae bacterium]